jgi:transposase
LVGDRNASQKHVWRAEIVLLTAEGLGTNEIMRRTAKSKTCVWRWQERFMEEGFEGLLRDKTRPSRIEPLDADVAKRVVAMTLTDPPGETTHWTGAMMAEAIGISVSSVQRIWRAHGLQPIGFASSSSRTIRSSSINCGMWLASMSIRPHTPLSCRSMKRARFRLSIALNPVFP